MLAGWHRGRHGEEVAVCESGFQASSPAGKGPAGPVKRWVVWGDARRILLPLGWFYAVALGIADLQETVIFIWANLTSCGHPHGWGWWYRSLWVISGAGCQCQAAPMNVARGLTLQMEHLHKSFGHTGIHTHSLALVCARVQGVTGGTDTVFNLFLWSLNISLEVNLLFWREK